MSKRAEIELRGASRRRFIQYSIAVGAALGLDRWKIFEVTERTAGKALAGEMSCAVNNRSVHIVAGNGGLAWFNLLWPHVDVAKAGNGQFAIAGTPVAAAGTDKPLMLGPTAPWKSRGQMGMVSAFMSGQNQTHTDAPTSSSTIGTGTSLFAACAALQASTPTLVPVIAVNTAKTALPYGAANGAPPAAQVSNADGMVDLFNSAASSAMGTLSNPKDAALYEAYYKGFLGLSAAAGRSTMVRGLRTGKVASNLLGLNLASQLKPTAGDLQRYGMSGGSPTKLVDFAKALCTTAKAFKLGLTSSVLMPAMEDDPHGAFADMNNLNMTITAIGAALDAFMNDLAATDDPTCGGTKIADNVVISIHGDTPKDPLNMQGWPDGTPGNSNWVWALGAGWLKTGWFGGIHADGSFSGFDPTTGADMPGQPSSATSMSASAAIAYAVTKGDMRRVNDFYRGADISGIVRPKQM